MTYPSAFTIQLYTWPFNFFFATLICVSSVSIFIILPSWGKRKAHCNAQPVFKGFSCFVSLFISILSSLILTILLLFSMAIVSRNLLEIKCLGNRIGGFFLGTKAFCWLIFFQTLFVRKIDVSSRQLNILIEVYLSLSILINACNNTICCCPIWKVFLK